MYYKALTGSQQLHIDIATSDTDWSIITNDIGNKPIKCGNDNFHYHLTTDFISYVFDMQEFANAWKGIVTLFSEPVVETEFSRYLIETREELVASNLPRFGNILLDYAKIMSSQGKGKMELGRMFPKRTVYAVTFLNAYINYAMKETTFEEAFKLSDELIEFCRGIKLRAIPYEIQIKKLNSMLAEAESLKWFYDKQPDLVTFNRIKNEMKALLDIT
jgi:hypothetical protein